MDNSKKEAEFRSWQNGPDDEISGAVYVNNIMHENSYGFWRTSDPEKALERAKNRFPKIEIVEHNHSRI